LVVSLTLAFNQFVNPWALDALGWRYYLVYCGWLIFELVFIMTFVVETRGRTLEETAALFDGEQRQQDIAQTGGEAAARSLAMRRHTLRFSWPAMFDKEPPSPGAVAGGGDSEAGERIEMRAAVGKSRLGREYRYYREDDTASV